MRKVLGLSVVLMMLAALLSACDASITPVAARVNGSAISVSSLNDMVSALGSSSGYRCDITAEAQGASVATPVIFGVGSNTYASSFVAQQLEFLIGASAMHQGVVAMHLPTSAIANKVAVLVLDNELSPPSSSTCPLSGAEVLNAFSPSVRNVLIGLAENDAVIAAHLAGTTLTPAGIRSYERNHLASTQLSCTDAIEVPTAAKAAAVERQLAAGASFAAVAKADSSDTATAAKGGSLGCLVSSEFPSPLDSIVEKLALDKVSAAIPYDGDFVVLLVTVRKIPSPEVAGETLVGAEEQVSAYSNEIDALYGVGNVVVSPSYGKWGKISGSYGITPPSGPPIATLTNPGAITPHVLPASS